MPLPFRPLPVLTAEQIARFHSRVAEPDANGCTRFVTPDTSNAYQSICFDWVNYRAHRVAYYLAHGVDPGDLTVEHTCRNKACVNPEHLTLLTVAENVLAETSNGIGAINARKTHCKRGHEFTDENTRVQTGPNGRPYRSCRECERARHRALHEAAQAAQGKEYVSLAERRRRRAEREAQREAEKAARIAERFNHCKAGHPLEGPDANVRVYTRPSTGHTQRICVTCETARTDARRRRLAAK